VCARQGGGQPSVRARHVRLGGAVAAEPVPQALRTAAAGPNKRRGAGGHARRRRRPVEVWEITPTDNPTRCGRPHPHCHVSMAGRPSSPRAMARPPSAQLNACDPSLVVKLPLVVTPLSSTANLWWQTTSDVRSRAPGSLSQIWRLAPFGSDYFKPGLVEPADSWWYRVTNTPELLTSNDHTHAKDDCNLIHSFRLPAYLFLPNNGRYNSCSC
jgi:hypothetical protein